MQSTPAPPSQPNAMDLAGWHMRQAERTYAPESIRRCLRQAAECYDDAGYRGMAEAIRDYADTGRIGKLRDRRGQR